MKPNWYADVDKANCCCSIITLSSILLLYYCWQCYGTYWNQLHLLWTGLCVGLCTNGVTPDAAAHMIKVAIQPVLVYGCATINISLGAMKTLEKTQGRLVKSALGLPKYCRNTPLLKALGIRTIRLVVNNNQLSIMLNALWNTSRARNFHMCMLKKYEIGVITYKHNSLISRCTGAPNLAKFRGGCRFDKGGVTKFFKFLRDKNINFLEFLR